MDSKWTAPGEQQEDGCSEAARRKAREMKAEAMGFNAGSLSYRNANSHANYGRKGRSPAGEGVRPCGLLPPIPGIPWPLKNLGAVFGEEGDSLKALYHLREPNEIEPQDQQTVSPSPARSWATSSRGRSAQDSAGDGGTRGPAQSCQEWAE
jgi:hypothetical protein